MKRSTLKGLKRILMATIGALAIAPSLYAATPLELRKYADDLREEGLSLKAIDIYNHAIVGYQEAGDYANMVEALTGRLLCWKHLFYKTDDKIYAIFVKTSAQAMLEIAQVYGLTDRMHLIHFLNATAGIQLKDYPYAEKEYAQAIELFPVENAEKGDWTGQLGAAMYRNGKKAEGLAVMLNGIAMIELHRAEIDSFHFNVWVSGANLRLAKLLRLDSPAESQSFLEKAKAIIDGDDRLVIRKQQLEAYLAEIAP